MANAWHPDKVWHEMSWFWREALKLDGSALPLVLPTCLIFGLLAFGVVFLHRHVVAVAIEVGPHEVAGALLGLILVMRTNMGYERWWEARRLWGGIVNQCRNLVVDAMVYGPQDPAWRQAMARTTAAFAHACRMSLRGEQYPDGMCHLLGADAAALAQADHMPSWLSARLAALLQQAVQRGGMERVAFRQADEQRAELLDHLGGCERILKTPMPKSYSVKFRGFILLFLGTLPFAMVDRLGLLTPLLVVLVAYPVLALDQAGVELQNPFLQTKMNHLPLDEITEGLERNLLALAEGPLLAPQDLDPGPPAGHGRSEPPPGDAAERAVRPGGPALPA